MSFPDQSSCGLGVFPREVGPTQGICHLDEDARGVLEQEGAVQVWGSMPDGPGACQNHLVPSSASGEY